MRRALLVALLLLPSLARAHGLDPASLTLRETAPGVFDVQWRVSALRLPGADVEPVLPARCRPVSTTDVEDANDHVTLRWRIDCGGDLAGETVAVRDLAAAKINALVTVVRLDGEEVQEVLGPRRAACALPAHVGALEVARSYVALGVEHILTGPDHLLFVFGLLLLVATRRLLVQTITAFTLGHSVSLSAAALHLANVPPRPIEVLIALSVLVLAVELAREAAEPTWLRRFPWAMAVGFGVLHGFGFAGALAEAGLPPHDVPLALVAFNVGIELGQLAFVATVLAAGALLARLLPAVGPASRRLAVYAMGILAAFWCFERLAAWLA
jgi:hydrogenase/urease accessory protein HupE